MLANVLADALADVLADALVGSDSLPLPDNNASSLLSKSSEFGSKPNFLRFVVNSPLLINSMSFCFLSALLKKSLLITKVKVKRL